MAFTKLEPTGVNTSATFAFSNVSITGNLTVSEKTNLGAVGNITITGGTSGYVLGTDGSGALSWVAQTGGGGTDYSNANVASYLPTFTGELSAGNINASGNITATYVIGNGSQLTGLPASYSNTNVAAYLPTYTGNISANYFIGNGSSLTHITGANIDGQVSSSLVAGTVTTAAQPNITSTGTLNSVTVNGTANLIGSSNVSLGPIGNVHITGGTSGQYLQTDGSGTLSWATVSSGSTSNISNGTSNVNIATSGGNVTTSVGGTANVLVVSSDGADIEGNLEVSTNIIAGTGSGGSISGANSVSANYFTGNGSLLVGLNASNISSGTIPSGVLGNSSLYVGTTEITLNRTSGSQSLTGVNIDGSAGTATTAGTVTTAAQPNITSIGTLVDANISGNLFVGGNLTVNGTTEYTNVNNLYVKDPIIEMGGNANAGSLTTNDGKDRGSLLHYYTTEAIDAFMGWDNSNGEFAFGSNVSISSEVVTFNTLGNVRANTFIGSLSGTASSATTAATVTTNAQPNITSVGTLTGLTVSNSSGVVNLITTANVSLGDVGNLHITGGTTGQYLQTDGSGTLSWATVSSGSSSNIANGTSNVNIPAAGGNVNTSVDGNANVLVVTGAGANVNGYLTVSGALSTGGGAGGSLIGANVISANYFIGDGSQLTGLPASYSNTNVAAYLPTYTGNISANYFIGNGSSLTHITGANVTGQVGNALIAGTVTTNAQPNITSVGTLTGLITTDDFISGGTLVSNYSSGNEGGEIRLALSQTGTTLNSSVTIDMHQNRLRIFESGGTNRGGFFDITAMTAGVGTDLLAGGSGGYANSNVAAYLPTYTGNFTAGNINVTGNVTSAYFIGNGSSLSALNASNVSSGTIPSGVLGNSTVYVGTTSIALNRSSGSQSLTGVSIDGSAGTVTTNAQPNITSTGTLASLTVSGLVTATAGGIKVGNIQDSTGTNTISVSSTTTGIIGNLNVGTGGAGNVTATYFIGNGSQLTGLPASYSNANVAAYLPTYTGNFTAGNGTVSGSFSVNGSFSAGGGTGGSISGANVITANYFVGNGSLLTSVVASSATTAGTVTTNAQPNITSVGSLVGLTVAGNLVLQQSQEAFQAKSGASGSVTHDFATGCTFWHTSVAGNFTAAVTNLPTTSGRVSILSLIIVQGATPYICNAITINGGSSLTIKWVGGTAPSGTANKTEAMVFSIFNNSGTYTVLGQLSSYG